MLLEDKNSELTAELNLQTEAKQSLGKQDIIIKLLASCFYYH